MLGVVIFGSYLIINFLPVVPQLFKDLFFYGKIKGKVWTTAKKIEIPKRFFYFLNMKPYTYLTDYFQSTTMNRHVI